MINFKKLLKKPDSVTTRRQKPSGRNCPNKIPMMIARISFGFPFVNSLQKQKCESFGNLLFVAVCVLGRQLRLVQISEKWRLTSSQGHYIMVI